jgi:mercuric reductase
MVGWIVGPAPSRAYRLLGNQMLTSAWTDIWVLGEGVGMDYDLAIIGSGGAGFAAAIAATTKGLSVVMVERAVIGGTCVNVGCIPSKALLAAAEARHVAAAGRFPGIATQAGPVDMAALIAGKTDLVEMLRREKYEDLAIDYGWETRHGTARFVEGPALEIDGERIEAAQYLVATGAAPWVPEVPGLAETGYLTSTSALELEALPESVIVVGGNYVGLEMGQTFARLGSSVTLLEALPRLAPGEEPEISEVISEVLADEGVAVWTSAALAGVSADAGKVVARVGGGREVGAEAILMATGRRPVTAGLGLEGVGVETGRVGEVVVDGHQRSTNPRIWAAGDVTGAAQFVYVAGAQGSLVVDNAFFGAERRLDYAHLPRVTFTTPAIAAVGLTDAQVAGAGLDCTCSVLPLAFVPRAIVNRDTRGLVKIVAEKASRRVVGIHIVADNAGDMVLAATYALEAGMTIDQLASTWCPYLTMAEGIKLAAQSFDKDVAKLSCCAS